MCWSRCFSQHRGRISRNDLYIKGYKVDREKLLNNFTPRAWNPENLRMLDIWEKFPTEFLYLAMGNEPDGRISLVIVLAEGYDKEKLERYRWWISPVSRTLKCSLREFGSSTVDVTSLL